MLNPIDLDALAVLIDCLKTTPPPDKEVAREKAEVPRRALINKMFETGVTYGAAAGGALDFLGQPDAPEYIRSIDNDLGRQVQIVSNCFTEYLQFGEIPPPHYAWRIAIILRRADAHDLEREFLAAWCHQFDDTGGGTYKDLVDRLNKILDRNARVNARAKAPKPSESRPAATRTRPMTEEEHINLLGSDRITSRQIDELVGIARGLVADEKITDDEIAFLQKWLAANSVICENPLIRVLFQRVNEMLEDGAADEEEKAELLDTLDRFSNRDLELGEVLKATTLPLTAPPPLLSFPGRRYCFTGTFNYGQRKFCEQAVVQRGGEVGKLTKKTDVLVIGVYATESWKHSSFGLKILKACKMRDDGCPIAIVSEPHWVTFL